jgi:hypothetical protein
MQPTQSTQPTHAMQRRQRTQPIVATLPVTETTSMLPGPGDPAVVLALVPVRAADMGMRAASRDGTVLTHRHRARRGDPHRSRTCHIEAMRRKPSSERVSR